MKDDELEGRRQRWTERANDGREVQLVKDGDVEQVKMRIQKKKKKGTMESD